MKKTNVLFYYLFSSNRSVQFYIPILVPFFMSIFQDSVKVSVLFTVKSIAVFVTEIPLGYFADKISRKKALYLGTIFQIFSLLLLAYYLSFLILGVCPNHRGISSAPGGGNR